MNSNNRLAVNLEGMELLSSRLTPWLVRSVWAAIGSVRMVQ